jgi:hypothetical protein
LDGRPFGASNEPRLMATVAELRRFLTIRQNGFVIDDADDEKDANDERVTLPLLTLESTKAVASVLERRAKQLQELDRQVRGAMARPNQRSNVYRRRGVQSGLLLRLLATVSNARRGVILASARRRRPWQRRVVDDATATDDDAWMAAHAEAPLTISAALGTLPLAEGDDDDDDGATGDDDGVPALDLELKPKKLRLAAAAAAARRAQNPALAAANAIGLTFPSAHSVVSGACVRVVRHSCLLAQVKLAKRVDRWRRDAHALVASHATGGVGVASDVQRALLSMQVVTRLFAARDEIDVAPASMPSAIATSTATSATAADADVTSPSARGRRRSASTTADANKPKCVLCVYLRCVV